jgi:hypothetical protein
MGTLIITSIAILFIGLCVYSFIRAGKFTNQFERIYEDEIIKNSFETVSNGNISGQAIQVIDLNNVYKNIA